MSSLWMIRDRIVNRTLLFFVLVMVAVACTPVETWGIYGFVNDWWILLCATAFFAVPIARPRINLIGITVLSGIFVAPLLINPLGSWTSRDYYAQIFPYRLMPAELSLVDRYGLPSQSEFQFVFEGGRIYFLNENFYPEHELFWVHGESTLEFILELKDPGMAPRFQIVNGEESNHVVATLDNRTEEFHMQPSDTSFVDLSRYSSEFRRYEERATSSMVQ